MLSATELALPRETKIQIVSPESAKTAGTARAPESRPLRDGLNANVYTSHERKRLEDHPGSAELGLGVPDLDVPCDEDCEELAVSPELPQPRRHRAAR